ncbi:MAG: ATP-binding protein, partial [Oscillospiraceae bacterium]|nr:ATP-binding protein [Oscillospiraceae bacterium]
MVPRAQYMERLNAYRDNPLIKVITGLRRCGKSTLLQLFKRELLRTGVKPENIIDINFELMDYDEVVEYRQFYKLVREKIPVSGKCYLLLDEIQQVEHWEKAVNSLSVESGLDVDVYITGSNAHLLSSDISTLLSGRYVEIKMLPLSFKEFLLFDHLPTDWSREDKFRQYLKYGCLPAVTTLPQEDPVVFDFLLGIYNTVVVKDVVARTKSKDVALLEKIIRYVIGNTGNILSANKISGFLSAQEKGENVKSSTVMAYLDTLQKAYIVYQAGRFDIKGKEQLKTLSKFYVTDSGIRNALMGYTGGDIGHMLETVVYFELLRRGYSVFIGKWYDTEVDFLAVRQDTKKYYQVTTSMLSENVLKRELA